jgi:hypothetical protein
MKVKTYYYLIRVWINLEEGGACLVFTKILSS